MALGLQTSTFVEMARKALQELESRHRQEQPELERLNSHYEGTQPLSYMAPELVMELGDRLRQVVVHWPALVVDSVEERLDVEGFRLGGASDADDDLQWFWQANGLDEGSQRGHVDALVMRRSFAIVGRRSGKDLDPSSGVGVDVPLITVESPLEVFAAMDPRTRRVAAAGKWWAVGEDTPEREDHATLYLPQSTSWWVRKSGQWVLDEDDTPGIDEHELGVVPVVPIVNRPRTVRPRQQPADGVSDLAPVIPLSDAANKIATDMMVAAEFHAMPRRYALGFAAEDFQDHNGNPIDAFSRVAGRLWATEKSTVDGASVGQFPEAQLGNFHDTMKLLGMLVSSVSGLPPHYLGSPSDNPASADAIRSSEARLVKRAERKQRAFGGSWESVMRLALLFRDGAVAPDAARMETLWRDASTPTVAQKADAAVKLRQAGITSLRQTWEDLGYSAAQQERLEEDLEKEAEKAAAAFGVGTDPVMPGESAAPAPVADSEVEPGEAGSQAA